MLKSIVVIVFAVVVLTYAEPPPESGHGHGQFKGHSQQHSSQGSGHGQQQHGNVKIRQSGPSKIFGWIGSRFAKIPHYLPRFPQFPKHVQHHHKLPQYQAIILPDPPKSGSYYVGSKGHLPEKVKISQVEETPSYQDYSSVSEVIDHSYSPMSVGNVESYSVPESVPQIEVVPSTLLYHNKQVYSPGPQQAAPIAAPPLQQHHHHHQQQQQQQYNVIDDYRNTAASYASVNSIPASVVKKPIAPVKQVVASSNVPFVPHSTGPDYFDTAYRGGGFQQQQQQQHQHQPQQQQQQQQHGVYRAQASSYQQQRVPENNYGATFEIQSQGIPQIYDSSINLGAIGGPVIQSTQQQSYAVTQPQQGTHYTAPSASQNIQAYADQALNSQALSSLIASIPESSSVNQQSVYADYSGQVAAPATQHQQQQQQQQQYSSKSEIPGVQILSQGTDDGNPVFEVLADHDAPQFEGGHPFDINKLISMIEPGAQLESAELSQAASESKTTYTVPANQQSASSSSTSGITDLLLSESEPSPSLSKVDGSKFTRQLLLNSPLKTLKSSSSSILNINGTTNNHKNNNSSSSLKEIIHFFQQTGGKGYIVVEKKRHQPDNLTLDSDPNRDDDLTNGPTRVNITSESFLPQLELLNNNKKYKHSSNSSDISTSLDNVHSEDDRDLLFSIANNESSNDEEGQQQSFDENYNDEYYDIQEEQEEEQKLGQNDKTKNSVKLNLLVPPPPSPIPSSSSSPDNKRQPSSSSSSSQPQQQKQQQKTEKTINQSSTSSSSGNRNIDTTTTPKIITKTKTTTTIKPLVKPTQKSQLTTLFEPVTSGKPVIFTTTTVRSSAEPFLNSSNDTSSTSLHPNHNYFANPITINSKTNTKYPILGIIPSVGSLPTINPFLDTVDESVLDDPIDEMDEMDGDLSASESQQVRSIAITVTPPPKRLISTTTVSSAIVTSSSVKNKTPKGISTITSSSSSSSSSNGGTATTTDKPVSTSTVSSSIIAPVTKKTTLTGYPTKTRPSPVYMRSKTTSKPSN